MASLSLALSLCKSIRIDGINDIKFCPCKIFSDNLYPISPGISRHIGFKYRSINGKLDNKKL